ncbi:hypothetical protein ACFQ3Z_23005 [Streptomyces nogalater]
MLTGNRRYGGPLRHLAGGARPRQGRDWPGTVPGATAWAVSAGWATARRRRPVGALVGCGCGGVWSSAWSSGTASCRPSRPGSPSTDTGIWAGNCT